jgi:hypothetical protein
MTCRWLAKTRRFAFLPIMSASPQPELDQEARGFLSFYVKAL